MLPAQQQTANNTVSTQLVNIIQHLYVPQELETKIVRGVLFYLKPVCSFYSPCTGVIRRDILCILLAAAQHADLIAARHSGCKLMQLHYWSGLLLAPFAVISFFAAY